MKIAGKPTLSARAMYVRGILTLDLPAACDPILWCQHIKNITSIAFALHPLPDANIALVLRIPDAAEQIIATFGNPAAAEDALSALRTILLRPRRMPWMLRVLKWLMILLLFWLALRLGVYLGLNSQPAMSAPPQAMPMPNTAPIQQPPVPNPAPAEGQ